MVKPMTEQAKDFKWLRGLHKATFTDKKTELRFEITQNTARSSTDDKFIYKCFDIGGRLLFDRKINFAVAMLAVNSWSGDFQVMEAAPK
jgi:hypothetical protein